MTKPKSLGLLAAAVLMLISCQFPHPSDRRRAEQPDTQTLEIFDDLYIGHGDGTWKKLDPKRASLEDEP